MNNLPRVSIIVPTRDRFKDLSDLLLTVLIQTYFPVEVIIVDDSPTSSAKLVVNSFCSKFDSIGCRLKYVEGSGEGLTAGRNLGVKNSEGDAILFLDDDTLLDRNVISTLAAFLRDNPLALGVQPEILPSRKNLSNELTKKFEKAVYKVFMLTYSEKNKLRVRRSGASIFPDPLTKTISVQRLSGCCCYKRSVLDESSFDTNLKRYGFMEDLDYSYRLYKKSPRSLYAIPHVKIIHKSSATARLPTKLSVYMTTIYWFYVFFKDIFGGSILNLIAFLWALIGNLLISMGVLIIKRKPKHEWWGLIYLLKSYAIAFRNLKNILMGELVFFNKNFK
jgi:GT2 family glycosyltransferase